VIELRNDALVFSFPDVHRDAVLSIDFQRTLRIPDDDREYPLPPGMGRFPVRHVDDFAARVPERWLSHGGVMLPMYQSEAMWLNFDSPSDYPFAIRIATGKIDAVTGEAWRNGLHRDPQDYVVAPEQPWLDGYCVERGVIRQFVAMPLGSGYSAEEQLTGAAEHGGVQIVAYPMKREAYDRLRRSERRGNFVAEGDAICYSMAPASMDMGLAPGGRMRQEIYDDPHSFDVWDTRQASRCFVHLTNALVWRSITTQDPPTTPPTADEYTRAGLPWFEYYASDLRALAGGDRFGGMKSVAQLGKQKGDVPLPENTPVEPGNVVRLRAGLRKDQVREGAF
jgi:hypothetical protein